MVSALLRTHSRQKDPLRPKLEDLIEDLQQDVMQLLRGLLERAVNRSIPEKMCGVIKCEPLLFRMALIRQKIQALRQPIQDTRLDAAQVEVKITEHGTDILNLLLTIAHWVPDWFRRIEAKETTYSQLQSGDGGMEGQQISTTNHELLAWFQKDMAVVEIDWDGVHVLQWFFVPGYELQMTQDEVVAAVAATSGDTHVNKLAKFMRTWVYMDMTPQILKQIIPTPHPSRDSSKVLHAEFKPQHDGCAKLCPRFKFPKAWGSALQTFCFCISVLGSLAGDRTAAGGNLARTSLNRIYGHT